MTASTLSIALLHLGLSVSMLLLGEAAAAEVSSASVITIGGLHCEGCAKKVASKLEAVKAVASARVDVKLGRAVVTPVKDAAISPRALWEAVESSGYRPIRVDGPSGVFIQKPKF